MINEQQRKQQLTTLYTTTRFTYLQIKLQIILL